MPTWGRTTRRLITAFCGAALVVACSSSDAKSPDAHPGAPDAGEPKTTTGTLEVDGSSLYYEERGTGDAVVLLHGFTLDTRMWDHQFEALSKSHRVVRYDMRGHGRSSGARLEDGGALSFSQSEDVAGVLDSLDIDKAHIVGLSMGGYVAYEFSLDHPDRVLTLTIIDSAWRFDPARTSDFQNRLIGYVTTASSDLEAGLRAWSADALFVPASKIPSVKAGLDDIVLTGHLAQGKGAFFSNALSAVTPSPLAETHLGDLAMPTLVMVGTLDDPEFVAHANEIATAVSGSEKVSIEGSGHMSTMEKPDEVTNALMGFLAKH